jgi:hypothetical protein
MHAAGLSPHLSQLSLVFDSFRFVTQLARTSRRESYSGFIPPLEKARSCPPEQRKQG